ncbi:MAG TPA: arginine--tRNA ligase [Candidatus Dojkabacteria bacterium]|nr:arginine--tRNA ligase [Candidatus Dojkabacteria bacterium]
MGIEQKIKKLLTEAISNKDFSFSEKDIVIEIPADISNGHYSTNIAMRLASQLKRNPLEIAQEIVDSLEEDSAIAKAEVAKPGFINFFLSNRYLLTQISKIAENKGDYLNLDNKKGKKIVIEYTDANPFKEFHIGHLYTNSVGESFARLQEAIGAQVKRANYQGDIGLHVAKTLWGLEEKLREEEIAFEDLEQASLTARVRFLGEAYALGAEYYDDFEDKVVQKEVDEINYYIFSLVSEVKPRESFKKYEEMNLSEKYKKGRQWCLDYFETIYERLGTTFDYYFFESEVAQPGLEVVMKNIGEVFEEDDGSIIYKGDEKKNLHTRVFVNKHGIPTYEAKELGLAFRKGELVNYDESVVITGNEQTGYFRVVLDALSKLDKDLSEKTTHVPHGMVRLPGKAKMSSRKGEIVRGEVLLDSVKEKAIDIMEDNEEVDEDNMLSVSEKIAVAAIKYAFLKVSVGKDIIFDVEKSISFDGDTGPYLMYVYSRCSSILKGSDFENPNGVCIESCMENPFVKELSVQISRYEKQLLDSAMNYSPSTLAQYLFSLGQSFNSFYQGVRVLDASDEERQILLTLVKATMVVMQDGLDKLGIEVVEKM